MPGFRKSGSQGVGPLLGTGADLIRTPRVSGSRIRSSFFGVFRQLGQWAPHQFAGFTTTDGEDPKVFIRLGVAWLAA